jgi:RNA polymerase sigma factor (sigma-70 family)
VIARRTQAEAERLYMENQGLVGFAYRKYSGLVPFIDVLPEDVKQTIRMAMWEAALTFDGGMGAFSTWAMRVIRSDLLHARRKRLTNGRYAGNCLASLDTPVSTEVDVLLIDLLPSGDDMEARCIADIDLATTKERLKPKARMALDMKLRGMTQYEIAAELGCKQPQVSRYLKQAASFAAD